MLITLENIGILKKINEANISRYELQRIGEIHIHAKCIKCNEIIHIEKDELIKELKLAIDYMEKQYKIISTNITFSEVCEKCQKEILFNTSSDKLLELL